jgi:hypothetical protein
LFLSHPPQVAGLDAANKPKLLDQLSSAVPIFRIDFPYAAGILLLCIVQGAR